MKLPYPTALGLVLLFFGCQGPDPNRCPYRLPLRCGGECMDLQRAYSHTCECPPSCSCYLRYGHPPPSPTETSTRFSGSGVPTAGV